MSGLLVLVATPIGNLGDLSPRSVEALRAADAICCEDTRRTGRLLAHAGVPAPRLIVVNEHTEGPRLGQIVRLLDEGLNVVVVSDAGTPGISDPGERVVAAAVAAGHQVSTIPGPSAVIAAVVISGLPTGRFVVEGFLPRKGSARAERIRELAVESRTAVLYEAPHRLARTLADLVATLGPDRSVVIARELTKLHEEVWRGTLGDALERASGADPIGEHVLVLAGAAAAAPADDDTIVRALDAALTTGLDRKSAIAVVARELNAPKRVVYELAHGLGAQNRTMDT